MKSCPKCGRTYPETEKFCAQDGTQLQSAQAGQAQVTERLDSSSGIQCPVCGGRALAGEEMCSFCGTRLTESQESGVAQPTPSPTIAPPRGYPPASQQFTQSFDDESSGADTGHQDSRSSVGRVLSGIGYALAALAALAGGIWFALHLSSGTPKQVANAPSATAIASPAAGPMVDLASNQQVNVTGESAFDPARNKDAATKLFQDNKGGLLDAYKHALEGDPTLSDGLDVHLVVTPDGTVASGTVLTSTSPNPALDSETVKIISGWHFAPFGGTSVEVDYPVVFASNAGDRAAIESALADKMAHRAPDEPPEYAIAPAASPIASAAPPPAVAASPAALPTPLAGPPSAPGIATEPIAPSAGRHRHRPKVAIARHRPTRPPLLQLVQERLQSDNRLRRVKAYTNGGVVTLYGKVFDNKDRLLAERTVRNVDGVTDVINTLSTDTADWRERADRISRALAAAGYTKVTVKVIGHDAYLDGEVRTDLDKLKAVTVTQAAAPVTVRTNLIRVVPPGVFSF